MTYVQAFQFWLKVFAIALPACLLLIHLGGLPARAALFGDACRAPGPHGLVVRLGAPQPVTFPTSTPYAVTPLRRRLGRTRFRAAAGARVTLPGGYAAPSRRRRRPGGERDPGAPRQGVGDARSEARDSARRSSSTRC